jgi:hypothetical protein
MAITLRHINTTLVGFNVTYGCSSRLAESERISIRCLSLFAACPIRDAAGYFFFPLFFFFGLVIQKRLMGWPLG